MKIGKFLLINMFLFIAHILTAQEFEVECMDCESITEHLLIEKTDSGFNLKAKDSVFYTQVDTAFYDKRWSLFFLYKNNLWGVFSYHSDKIIPIHYEKIIPINRSEVFVIKNGKMGAYNINSIKYEYYRKLVFKKIIPCEYDTILSKIIYKEKYFKKYFFVKKHGLWGIYNTKGETILPLIYNSWKEKGNIIKLKKNNENFYYFKDSLVQYDSIKKMRPIYTYHPTSKKLITLYLIKKKSKWGAIDKYFNSIISFKYNDLVLGLEQLFFAKKKNKWGILDFNEKVISPFLYDSIYQRGLKVIVQNAKGLMFYDNINHTLVKEPIFDEIHGDGTSEYIPISYKGKKTLINTKYELFSPFIYDDIYEYKGVFYFAKNEKYGLMDKNKKIIIPPEYDYLSINKNLIKVEKNGKYGILNFENNALLALQEYPIALYENHIEIYKSGRIVKLNYKLECIENCD